MGDYVDQADKDELIIVLDFVKKKCGTCVFNCNPIWKRGEMMITRHAFIMGKCVPLLFVNKLRYDRYNTNGFKNQSDTIKQTRWLTLMLPLSLFHGACPAHTRQHHIVKEQFQRHAINNRNATAYSTIKRLDIERWLHNQNKMTIFDIWLTIADLMRCGKKA